MRGGSNQLVSVEQAAEYLGCSPRFLREHRERLGIPSIRLGGLLRFRQRDLDNFVERTAA